MKENRNLLGEFCQDNFIKEFKPELNQRLYGHEWLCTYACDTFYNACMYYKMLNFKFSI